MGEAVYKREQELDLLASANDDVYAYFENSAIRGRRIGVLPGQYFDQETGMHYNYFRDYDPSLGRYITSDPIGLAGGLNTYVYVENNPLKYIDFFGLAKCSCKAPQTGNRVNGAKICSYNCSCEDEDDCGNKTKNKKTIKVSAGSGGSATCKGQWEDPWQPNPNSRTGFDSFNIDTNSWWDRIFNSDFVNALR